MNLKKSLEWFFTVFQRKKNSEENIAAPSSSSNFPLKLGCSGILVFVCVGKSMPMRL